MNEREDDEGLPPLTSPGMRAGIPEQSFGFTDLQDEADEGGCVNIGQQPLL